MNSEKAKRLALLLLEEEKTDGEFEVALADEAEAEAVLTALLAEGCDVSRGGNPTRLKIRRRP